MPRPNTNDIDRLMQCDFKKVLLEAKKFNSTKTTIFDIMMALIQAMLGSLQIKESIISENFQNNINSILSIIQPQRSKWENNNNQSYSDMESQQEQE